jgi:hypothetical protein
MKESLTKSQYIKEISFLRKFFIITFILGCTIPNEGFEILNKILLKNEKIEKFDLKGFFKKI